jgi:predicted CXXCH cytochrome family protein
MGDCRQLRLRESVEWRSACRRLILTLTGWLGFLLPSVIAGQAEMPTPIELGPSCVTADCHGEMAPGPDVHGPLNVGNCEICHEVVENRHEFRSARAGSDLCGHCHELALEDVIHAPVSDGDCTGCHDPHRSSHAPLLIRSPTEGLCLTCHEDDGVMKSEFLHGPVGAGLCVLCHESHSSANLHLVRQGGNELCMLCHREELGQVEEMRHIHEPLSDGSCLICHNPHGGTSASLTHEPPPGICLTCHEEMEARVASSRVVHSIPTDMGSCSACHDPHASPRPRLLKGGELDLCLGCHGEELETAGGDLIPGISTLIRTSEFLHGPVRDGNCTECHDPHASETFRLLVHDYPPEFYAPFDTERYALCFQCHSEESFLTESTETLSNFRDGSDNLHFVHVSRDTRGRTCRACHEVHASNLPFHMSESVPYGGWELPINFEQLDDGGRCSPGCHEPQEYHRAAVVIEPRRTGQTTPGEDPAAE